jgi:uncharacterized protein (TIGR03435 family)
MLQNLLVQRFKITLRHATKDAQSYELVLARKGSKLTEVPPSANAPGPRAAGISQTSLDRDGFPILPDGRNGLIGVRRENMFRITCRACSVAQLISRIAVDLAVPIGSPVSAVALGRIVDKTELAGFYDFHLEYSGGGVVGGALNAPSIDEQSRLGPDLFGALENQLGLKLQKTTTPLDVLAIDLIERVPEEN